MDRLAIFWFRRDLRLDDNHGLYLALNSGYKVLPLFIFDSEILNTLDNPYDVRVQFIYDRIITLKTKLNKIGSDILIRYGSPETVFRKLLSDFQIQAVYANIDFESYAKKRDNIIESLLNENGIKLNLSLDHLISHPNFVLKADQTPYTVFTPYSNKWKESIKEPAIYPSETLFDSFLKTAIESAPTLNDIGFKKSNWPDHLSIEPPPINPELIINYHQTRDIPSLMGTSRLGVHLRFGTLSIRSLFKETVSLNATFINELIWREFYAMILHQFPHVEQHPFKKEYERIKWENDSGSFDRWKEGSTGFPLVDAGMRELNQTGYMHNRVRMVTASFLTKHLLIDYRLGEAWFAAKLLDFDLASNNGGWQWAASTGCDAAPYFRIFNPTLQQERFDPHFNYIKKWVPEFGSLNYVKPMVNHAQARERAIKRYKEGLSS